MKLKKSIFIVAVLFLFGCGSSVESEQLSWERKKTTIQEYSAAYPYLKANIDKQYQQAVAAMEKAKSISDEEQKITAMRNANNLAFKGTIDKVMDLETMMDKVASSIKKIKEEFTAEEFTQKTNFLLEEANMEIEKAEVNLQTANQSAEMALFSFEKSTNKLKDVEQSLNKHQEEIQENRKKIEKETAAKAQETEEKVAPIANVECKKCGGLVNGNDVKCGNCGAPVKK